MVKYYLTYKGIDGDTFLFEIFEEGFDGQESEIHGYVDHEYVERKDLVQYSVASSLDINLEANEDFTLQDLYTEEESKFKVRLKRNDQVIFYGILKPDGIWEDFTTTRWTIKMDAMDGLSILKDLSFVKDDGRFYTGKITQFEALKQCLHRIGYDLPINITKDLPVYDDFVGASSILSAVQMNADRFYQDAQKNNIMDCEAVLKSILEPYSATLIQMNGEWWVFRPIDVKNEMEFFRYDGATVTDNIWNGELNIGSHIDQYEVFHANANQKKSINPSTQAFRVNYKYGTVKSIVDNSYLEHNGSSIEGWTFNPPFVYLNPSGRGVIVRNNDDMDIMPLQLNQSVDVKANDIVTFNVNMFLYLPTTMVPQIVFIRFFISTDNYYLIENSGWVLKSSSSEEKSGEIQILKEFNGDITWSIDAPPFPEDSNVYYKMRTFFEVASGNEYTLNINSIEITPSQGNYKGEFHTAQRLTRISSVTKADKTVSVGDSLSDIYLGTLYKTDGDPTEFWNGTTKPLLQLMVEDTLRIAPRAMYFFEGDVCGYFPYLANILINNVPGKYQVSKYSYDTKNNVNRTNFKEFDNVELIEGTDYRYEFEYDYGNETKVTIKS